MRIGTQDQLAKLTQHVTLNIEISNQLKFYENLEILFDSDFRCQHHDVL